LKPLPLVALHGFLGRPAMWESLGQELVVEPLSLPGHGPDPWYPEGNGFVASARALLRRCPARFCLLGYSQGARLALAMATLAPERIERMLLLGVHPGLESDKERVLRQKWDAEQRQKLRKMGLAGFVAGWESMPLFASQADLDPHVLERQRRQRLQHDVDGLMWSMVNLGLGCMPSWWPELPQLPMPVGFMAGELDSKFLGLARRAALHVPQGQVLEVPLAGHNPILERPTEACGLIAQWFLRRVAPAK
jgi:2-succinyl-6-hydroxy-2,4-cyclohexadiene-1-carboxylate synthase